MSSTAKSREESKRDQAWNPRQRWLVLQETITWAEAQLPYADRRNRPRLPKKRIDSKRKGQHAESLG